MGRPPGDSEDKPLWGPDMPEQSPPFVEAKRSMTDASPCLSAPERLKQARDREGYLYLKGAVPAEAIAWVRGEIIAALVEADQLYGMALDSHQKGQIDTRWTGNRVEGIGIPGRQAQAGFKQRRIWETFVEMPGVRSLFEQVAGGPVDFLPISEFRSAAPESRTPVHQDGAANYGYEVQTAWFPLMPIDAELGGLAILPRNAGAPYPPLQETGMLPPELAADPAWVRGGYEPGDMVVFDGSIVHCGLINHSQDRLRLSMEIRFQGPSAPRPLLGRIASIDPGTITIATDQGDLVALAIDDHTRLRGDRIRSTALIPRAELPGSDLIAGFPVIVAHCEGTAISVRGVF